MPAIKTLYSDIGRSSVIRKSIQSAISDKAQGLSYLSDGLVLKLQELQPQWEEKVLALNQHLSLREKEVREKNKALRYLRILMRDMWVVLKRRVKRMEQPNEVLTFYQLPLSGKIPNIKKEADVLAITEKMVEGDARAVEAGYPAMQNPSAVELQDAITKAKKEINDVAPADRQYDMAQEAVDELRVPVDNYIRNIIDELKFNLRTKDSSNKRRILRSYGIEFVYRKDESKDDDSPIQEDID